MNFIVSLLLGMLPEVLYFTMFLTFTKNIKEKRIKLFLLLALGYILLIMICRYQLLFYVTYIIYSYLVLKLLYNSHIIDLFVYSLSFCYIITIAYIFYLLFFDNYVLYYITARIFLFLPFIFKNKFNIIYKKYLSLWNYKKENKIKSLTLRNYSLLLVNITIIFLDFLVVLALIDFNKLGG